MRWRELEAEREESGTEIQGGAERLNAKMERD